MLSSFNGRVLGALDSLQLAWFDLDVSVREFVAKVAVADSFFDNVSKEVCRPCENER